MFEIKELFERGFHYGHRKWRSNPKMKDYIFCQKWGVDVIDLCKTTHLFQKAIEALSLCVKKGGKILFVGTKHQAQGLVEEYAKSCNQFYVNKRWFGGTITNNYSTIGLPLNKLKKMEKEEENIVKLAKHERLNFLKQKEHLISLLGGIRELGGVPDMLIVVDPKRENIAVREAHLRNIPVIALADTDTPEPSIIKYLVPGNDEGTASIQYFLEQCAAAINAALEKNPTAPEKTTTKEIKEEVVS